MVKGFEPIIDDSCEILILGTMPGVESIRKQEYYTNKRNQFWNIVFSLFSRKVIENYEQKKQFLLENHIAIWDVLYSCDREGSSDSNIKNTVANDFKWLYEKYPKIKSIYFNGKKSEELYRKLVIKNVINEGVLFITLSSTSPANAIKFEEKLERWKVILLSLKELRNSDIISIRAFVGGFTGSSYQVHIDVLNGVADYKYMHYGYRPTSQKRIALSQDSLIKFLHSLYENNVFNWKHLYESEYRICDGTSWDVSIITKEKNCCFQGNNEHPKQWDKFCKSIETLIREKFF